MANEVTIDQVEVGQALPELAIEVTPTTVVLGALASRDWRPMHHDKDFAQERNGTRHVFTTRRTTRPTSSASSRTGRGRAAGSVKSSSA
jgi:hypothetical protein